MTRTITPEKTKSDKSALNGGIPHEVDNDLDEIKKDLSALKQDFSNLFESIGKAAKSKTNEGASKGSDLADQLGSNAKETQAYVEDQIKTRPLAAVGLALGAGFLFAKLRS